MLANFLHCRPAEMKPNQDLRKDWKMTDTDLEVLEIWIEGPISRSMPGFFQDAMADVSPADLLNPALKTVKDLDSLIWDHVPPANKTP